MTIRPEEEITIRNGSMRSIEAHALYRQALALIHPPNDPARLAASGELFRRVIEIAPDSPKGYSGLAYLLSASVKFGHRLDRKAAIDEVKELASKAISIDPRNARARIAQAIAATILGEHDRAIELYRTAIQMQPSNSHAHSFYGMMMVYAGRAAEGIEPLQTAIRLDPVNPRAPYLNMLGVAQFHIGDYTAALATFQKNIAGGGPMGPHILVYIAACHAEMGDVDKERAILKELRDNRSSFSVEEWLRRGFQDLRDVEKLLTVLDKIDRAGEPKE